MQLIERSRRICYKARMFDLPMNLNGREKSEVGSLSIQSCASEFAEFGRRN